MKISNLIFLGALIIFSLISTNASAFASAPQTVLEEKFRTLEVNAQGRLGISAINTANRARIDYRAQERFPMSSTFKVIAVAAILKQNMSNHDLLQQKINYTQQDVDSSGYAPVTRSHVGNGMTVAELCAAALMHSDNAAINALIKKLGGTAAVTIFARSSLHDSIFSLDRTEPSLNSAIPDDVRDTSTPQAMQNDLQQLTLGDVLALKGREQLQTWLAHNTTGDARIRAGVPPAWQVGDKTGTSDYGTTSDIGIIRPPHCPPIIVAIYFTQYTKEAAPRADIIASVTRLLIQEFAQTDQCLQAH